MVNVFQVLILVIALDIDIVINKLLMFCFKWYYSYLSSNFHMVGTRKPLYVASRLQIPETNECRAVLKVFKMLPRCVNSLRRQYICVSKLTIIVWDNSLSPGWCEAIMWINAGILLIGTLGTNVSEVVNEILTFSFKKMHLKIASEKLGLFCLGLNVF